MTNPAEHLLSQLPGINTALTEKLAAQGFIRSLDLLFLLPLHYQDRSRITPIADLRYGKKAQIEVQVNSTTVNYGRRRSLSCLVSDNTGSIIIRFFHFNRQQQASLVNGTRLRCYGEIRSGQSGLEIYHPKYNILDPNKNYPLPDRLQPIYPKVDGLGPVQLQKVIATIFSHINQHNIADPLLEFQLESSGLIDALRFVHNPTLEADIEQLDNKQHPMQLRLVRDELVSQRLSFLRIRKLYQKDTACPCDVNDQRLRTQLLTALEFQPTPDQLLVEQEIHADLTLDRPMLRLLQGDVGSGKTLVALLATLPVLQQGHQCALMAPTELLAEQHYQQCIRWLQPLGIEVAFMSSKLAAAEKRRSLGFIASGQAHIVVGTHAIIQDQVHFKSLVLAIIDEQHRFGVHQRLALRNKGNNGEQSPHQLIMTATPIPRTLAMSMYADLDVSIIHNAPPGRKPIRTLLMSNNKRDQLIARIGNYCQQGKQTYWVCPLVEDSEKINCESAEHTSERLSQLLGNITVGMIHGRLDSKTKHTIMNRFRAGDIQLLVATTVIEVGVDVANASVMVIENAERLGLAQLHQLRGRVGRGNRQSYCLLLYQDPVSKLARERLKIMHQSQSGFELAEQDLKLRGPGELLGAKQAGSLQMRIADVQLHQQQVTLVAQLADTIIQDDQATAIMLNRWFPNHTHYLSA